jgi:urease accessory protein
LTGSTAALLLLADGRLPAGGHAHSGGVEPAVADGRIASLGDLRRYLDGRLATAGRVDAGLAVAARAWACDLATDRRDRPVRPDRLPPPDGPGGPDVASGTPPGRGGEALGRLDAEAAARLVAPALRAASRAQGRGLLRAARRCWSSSGLDRLAEHRPDGPYHPLAVGVAAAAAGVDATGTATTALWGAVSAPAWAAVRLLGLDPLAVTAVLAALGPAVDREAAAVVGAVAGPGWTVAGLPAAGAPLTDIGAESHAAWEVRLFAS